MARILLLNGPNLNLLGVREPGIYGTITLATIEARLVAQAKIHGHELLAFQSNAESALIDRLHAAQRDGTVFVLVNPAGLTHTSVALRDAFAGTALPFIEIHMSNIFAREEFRHHSYLSGIAVGGVFGLGATGYELALDAACKRLAAI